MYQFSGNQGTEAFNEFGLAFCSKNSVALVLSSQTKVDPDIIFPRESFCNIDEGSSPFLFSASHDECNLPIQLNSHGTIIEIVELKKHNFICAVVRPQKLQLK